MRLGRADIAGVAARIDEVWFERWVELRLADGRAVKVASATQPLATEPMVYDGFDLLDDTLWAVCLARELAEWLGVPFSDQI
jgi:hypothetical protein